MRDMDTMRLLIEEKVIVVIVKRIITGSRIDWYLRKAVRNLLFKKNETCESRVLGSVNFAYKQCNLSF